MVRDSTLQCVVLGLFSSSNHAKELNNDIHRSARCSAIGN